MTEICPIVSANRYRYGGCHGRHNGKIVRQFEQIGRKQFAKPYHALDGQFFLSFIFKSSFVEIGYGVVRHGKVTRNSTMRICCSENSRAEPIYPEIAQLPPEELCQGVNLIGAPHLKSSGPWLALTKGSPVDRQDPRPSWPRTPGTGPIHLQSRRTDST